MNDSVKTGIKGTGLILAGVLAGSTLQPDTRPTASEIFGPSATWEYDAQGTDGKDDSRIMLVSVQINPDGSKSIIRVPKSSVREK